ncbi:MAG: 50S ribosomal protein L23 [Candidatus Nanoarchaeia archaeon]|nr:50S ribosomal protein L23 [Candidatus Nanoarchaeia archaeon]
MNTIILYPLTTEKSIRLMESENKLVFIVELKAKKHEIKEEVERIFKVKVINVKTTILPSMKKKAYVQLAPDSPAIDVATQLGLM